MFFLKLSLAVRVFVIFAVVVAISGSNATSRQFVCKATPDPPTPITDVQQQKAFYCALKSLNSGVNTFAMEWDAPGCHDSESGPGTWSAYSCL